MNRKNRVFWWTVGFVALLVLALSAKAWLIILLALGCLIMAGLEAYPLLMGEFEDDEY